MSFLYRTLFLFCLMTFFVVPAEAGNTKSVNQGSPMPTIAWNVTGGAPCTATTSYPAITDGIRTFWTVTLAPGGTGSSNFGGRIVGAPAASYQFTCSVPGDTDTATLVVCDNVLKQSDGAAACIDKTPNILTFTGPGSVTTGTGPTLSWTTQNSASCTITPGSVAASPASGGSVSMPAISANTTYTLTCSNGTATPDTAQVTVNVTALPVPTINTFTGPATVTSNTSPTLTWNVTNATSCTINPGAYTTSPVLSGSRAMAAITTNTTYTLSCMNGASGPTTGTVTVNVADPNLVVSASTFPSGSTLYQNTSYTLSGTVRNSGGAAAGAFSNNFSYNTGSGWTNPAAGYFSKAAGLAAVTTATADSYSFTPTTLGTVQLQYCVDSNNQIAEASGEGDNCVQSATYSVVVPVPATPVLSVTASPTCGGRLDATWNAVSGATGYKVSIDGSPYQNTSNTYFTFTGLAAGSSHSVSVIATNSTGDSAPDTDTGNASGACSTLTVGNCVIDDLARTCTTKVNWDITGAVAPSIYNLTTSTPVPGSNMVVGNNVDVTLERSTSFGNESNGNNTIEARDGGTVLQTRTAVASCAATSFFHTTVSENRCQPNPSIVITPNPAWIRSGDQATLTFGILANYPGVSCTVTGGVPATVINHSASATRTNHQVTTNPLTSAQNVRISCTAPGLTTPVTGQVRVNVLPEVEEI